MEKLSWKTMSQYSFTEQEYEDSVVYYTRGLLPSRYNTKKKRFIFRKKLKLFDYDGQIKLVTIPLGSNDFALYKSIPNGNSLLRQERVIFTVLRPSQRDKILYEITSGQNLIALGLSANVVYNKVKNNMHYINITYDYIDNFIKTKAQIVRDLRNPTKRPIIKSYKPTRPRQHWQIDTIHLTRDLIKQHNDKHDYVLVIIDIFSKYVYIKKLITKNGDKGMLSSQVAQYLKEIFHTGDIPKILQSDNGTEFKGEVIDVLNTFGVKQIFTPSYSPQTNGFVENKNKLIKAMLYMHWVHQKQSKVQKYYRYIDILSNIAFAINTSNHKVIKHTPIEVHFGIKAVYDVSERNNYMSVENITQSPENIDNENLNQIERGRKEQIKDDEEFGILNKEVREYMVSKNKQTRTITKDVSAKILKAAKKTENKQIEQRRNLEENFIPGKTFVKIISYFDVKDGKIHPLSLRYIEESSGNVMANGPKQNKLITDNPKIRDATEIMKIKQLPKTFEEIFIIHKKVQNANEIPYYILKPYNVRSGKILSNLIVQRKVQKLGDEWTSKFYGTFLIVIDPIHVDSKRVNDNSEFVERRQLQKPIASEQPVRTIQKEKKLSRSRPQKEQPTLEIENFYYNKNAMVEEIETFPEKFKIKNEKKKEYVIEIRIVKVTEFSKRKPINFLVLQFNINKAGFQYFEYFTNPVERALMYRACQLQFKNTVYTYNDNVYPYLGRIVNVQTEYEKIGLITAYDLEDTLDKYLVCYINPSKKSRFGANAFYTHQQVTKGMLPGELSENSFDATFWKIFLLCESFQKYKSDFVIIYKDSSSAVFENAKISKIEKQENVYVYELIFKKGGKRTKSNWITLDPDNYKVNNLEDKGDWTLTAESKKNMIGLYNANDLKLKIKYI